MGDTYWTEDKVRVVFEGLSGDISDLFGNSDNPEIEDKVSFLDFEIKSDIFESLLYPETNTGSRYLNPLWRQKIRKSTYKPTIFSCN